jgi:hypothetical protein
MKSKNHTDGAEEISKAVVTVKPIGDILTEEQVAQMLNVEPRTCRDWRRRGLPFLKITPRSIRYRLSDVQSWLDRRRTVIGG